jgi:hypothetical protein
MRLAGALNAYWSSLAELAPDVRALVGVGAGSAKRWESAPRVPAKALLLLPQDAFGEQTQDLRAGLERAWSAGPVASTLGDDVPELVLLVSAEGGERLGARLDALAKVPAMKGKQLALLSLESAVSPDAPARLVARGLAGVGLFELEPQRGEHYANLLRAIARAIAQAKEGETRVEALHPAIVWHY